MTMDQIVDLAEDYDAMVMVDDCHGEGVLGGGRGIVAHFKLQGRVTVEGGSYSKALGVQGGIIAGSEDLKEMILILFHNFFQKVEKYLLLIRKELILFRFLIILMLIKPYSQKMLLA